WSYAARTESDSAPCEQELMYTRCSKIGKRWRQRSASVAASTAKVGLSQVLVLQELVRRPTEHAPSRREDVPTIGDGERQLRILLDDEHRHAGLMDLLDDLAASLDEG